MMSGAEARIALQGPTPSCWQGRKAAEYLIDLLARVQRLDKWYLASVWAAREAMEHSRRAAKRLLTEPALRPRSGGPVVPHRAVSAQMLSNDKWGWGAFARVGEHLRWRAFTLGSIAAGEHLRWGTFTSGNIAVGEHFVGEHLRW